MEIVELKRQSNLLQCSEGGDCDPNIFNGGGAG